MQVHNEATQFTLSNTTKQILADIRKDRNFNVDQYIHLKCELLNSYMRKSNLKTCVIAVSGGVDSAVVLALCNYASKMNNSPILNVVPVCMPATLIDGVVNQRELQPKVEELCEALGLTNTFINMNGYQSGSIVKSIKNTVEKAFNVVGSTWAEGQLVPYARTPVLYYITSLFTDKKEPAIVVGTTNRDEGACLGYVGKASDGMVDVQLISDMHKSEVYQVAKKLGVPDSIINAVPTGDMFDSRTDEEVFGASYDIVEIFISAHSGIRDDFSHRLLINNEDSDNLSKCFSSLIKLHRYNAHKYNVGSPAIHLDIMPSGISSPIIPGCVFGWKPDFELKYKENMFKLGNIIKPKFVAPVPFNDLSAITFGYNLHRNNIHLPAETKIRQYGDIKILENLLSPDLNSILLNMFKCNKSKKSNERGYITGESTYGSNRVSWYSVEFADLLWKTIRKTIDTLVVDDHTSNCSAVATDSIYRAVGINPLMRFIGYDDGGLLVPHYDYSYIDENYKSLYSLVIYLTTNKSGKTRFHKENDVEIKALNDWPLERALKFNEECVFDDFILEYAPVKFSAAIFPHYMLHDSMPIVNEEKIIIRTDIMFEQVKFSGF